MESLAMEIPITAKFWKKFFQFLLLGFSTMILLAVSQSSLRGGLYQGPSVVIAEEEDGETLYVGGDQNIANNIGDGETLYVGSDQTTQGGTTASVPSCPVASSQPECLLANDGKYHAFWVTRYANDCKGPEKEGPNELCGSSVAAPVPAPGPAVSVPAQPSRNDQCNPVGSPQGDCSDSTGNRGHHFCVWQPDRNVIGSCVIEACRYGGTPPNNCRTSAPSCTSNGSCSAPAPACGTTTSGIDSCGNSCSKQGPACGSGCTSNNSCSVQVPSACGQVNQGIDNCGNVCFRQSAACPPPEGSPGQQPGGATVEKGTCYVCDNGNWRPGGNNPMTFFQCSAINNSGFNQKEKPIWCQAPQQPPTPPAPTCRSAVCPAAPAGCGYSNQITNTCDATVNLTCGTIVCNPGVTPPVVINPAPITITNNPVNTVTINNPAPVTFGNVGVGTTVYTQGIQATQLPKTGLPALVWSALAFIPAGFKMRRFSKVRGQLENHPSYIFEDRQFKAGS